MFFTADQLVAHAIGDYVLQSDWMATEKLKRSLAAAVHVLTYMLPFLFLTRSVPALAVIVGTHFVIDRWRLARYVVWFTNLLGSPWGRARQVLTLDAVPPAFEQGAEGKTVWTNQGGGGMKPYKVISVSPDGATLRAAGPKTGPIRPIGPTWEECKRTGFPAERPDWLAMWLLFIVDNLCHVVINASALRWLV